MKKYSFTMSELVALASKAAKSENVYQVVCEACMAKDTSTAHTARQAVAGFIAPK